MLGFRAVWSESGGKAWFGGLACSGLAGYRACYERGNASVKHFLPPYFLYEAIIPEVTDKLLLVIRTTSQNQLQIQALCSIYLS